MSDQEILSEELQKSVNRYLRKWLLILGSIATLAVAGFGMILFEIVLNEAKVRVVREVQAEIGRSISTLNAQIDELMIQARDAQDRAGFASEKIDALISSLEEAQSETKRLRKASRDYANAVSAPEGSATARTILRRLSRIEKNNAAIQQWLTGGYCVLANGKCPDQFTRYEGYMKAIMVSETAPTHFREAKFGDSSIEIRGGDYGQWIGQLGLELCCRKQEEGADQPSGTARAQAE